MMMMMKRTRKSTTTTKSLLAWHGTAYGIKASLSVDKYCRAESGPPIYLLFIIIDLIININ